MLGPWVVHPTPVKERLLTAWTVELGKAIARNQVGRHPEERNCKDEERIAKHRLG